MLMNDFTSVEQENFIENTFFKNFSQIIGSGQSI